MQCQEHVCLLLADLRTYLSTACTLHVYAFVYQPCYRKRTNRSILLIPHSAADYVCNVSDNDGDDDYVCNVSDNDGVDDCLHLRLGGQKV